MVSPFKIEFSDSVLVDLQRRLANTRWPIDPGNHDWRYGVPREYLVDFVDYWRTDFDWRAQEAAMNLLPHFMVELDGIALHFIHCRGEGADPMPLVLTHGWPWTFIDLVALIDPLTRPSKYGRPSSDSFDVVIPSLPGFALSSPLTRTGIGATATAALWRRLMHDVLGYPRFGAQGCDFGAIVTQLMAQERSDDLIGIHLNRYKRPSGAHAIGTGVVTESDYATDEQPAWERHRAGVELGASHLAVQTRDPQTLAYGMHDSPVALAAWILERRRAWSDCGGDLDRVFSKDFLITTVMLYWLTETFVTSARFYWETAHERSASTRLGSRVIDVPTAIGVLPHDIIAMPRRHADEDINLLRWTEYPRGGHFGPAEVPDLYVNDLREFFRPLR